ncbi:MAG: hypothetical protein ABFS39_19235 [Pseudomonadota bacterium]
MENRLTDRRKRAIIEIRKTIPGRIAELDEQFVEAMNSDGECDVAGIYAEAMTGLMLDVVEHAITYTHSAKGLEIFRDRLQGAVDTLNVAIDVWNESHYSGDVWHRKFEEVMKRQQ